jgi:hypothetical protein
MILRQKLRKNWHFDVDHRSSKNHLEVLERRVDVHTYESNSRIRMSSVVDVCVLYVCTCIILIRGNIWSKATHTCGIWMKNRREKNHIWFACVMNWILSLSCFDRRRKTRPCDEILILQFRTSQDDEARLRWECSAFLWNSWFFDVVCVCVKTQVLMQWMNFLEWNCLKPELE